MIPPPSARPSVRRPSGVLIPAEVVILKIDTNRAGVTERRTDRGGGKRQAAEEEDRRVSSRGRRLKQNGKVTETEEWKFEISGVSGVGISGYI